MCQIIKIININLPYISIRKYIKIYFNIVGNKNK